jgi:hypothetical protein
LSFLAIPDTATWRNEVAVGDTADFTTCGY